MTIVADALRMARGVLEAAGIEAAALEARLLLAHATGETPARLVGWPERAVSDEARRRFEAMIARRVKHEPVAHLLGEREFWGLGFRVTPATLIPRPDTETLVEIAIDALRGAAAPPRLLDIGTGSGCILIALLDAMPSASGFGVDLSRAALDVARDNAARLGVADRATWCEGLSSLEPGLRFELVAANLPYIPSGDIPALEPDVRDYEPHSALDGGPDGLAVIREIAALLPGLLIPDGLALFEVGIGQAIEVERVFEQIPGLRAAGVWPDLSGVPRVVGARLRGD